MMPVESLQPGMRLYRSLYNGHIVLLSAGRILEWADIDALRRHYPQAQLYVCDPVLDELVEFQDDSHDQEVSAHVQQRLGQVLGTVRQKLGARTSLDRNDVAQLQQSIAEVMDYIQQNPVTAVLLLSSANWSSHLQEHPANVFYLALLMGSAIRHYVYQERERFTRAGHLQARYGMDLTPLAVGALFHDIGMVPLESLYGRADSLGPAERELVRTHPTTGEAMLPAELDAVARMVVRTHHESCDGSGYPQGLRRERLHIFARIIRIADAYDAATSPRVYRQAKSPARVLWEMTCGPYERLYDPIVLKVFAGMIQPFPIGAKIRLASGCFGVVVRHNRLRPFEPKVIIAFDEYDRRIPKDRLGGMVDLGSSPETRPVQFAGEDLNFLASEIPAEPPEMTHEEAETLFDLHYP
jgi:HD-GYP domain-containing protein (c-di-GMP phosphodiesterase class II)